MPFLQFTISHTAGHHFSRLMGESSMTVPALAENFCLSCFTRHFHTLALAKNVTAREPQRGQTTPSGQRRLTMKLRQVSGSEKYRIASISVVGKFSLLMPEF